VPGIVAHPDVPGPLSSIDAERSRNRTWATRTAIVAGVVLGLLFSILGLPISIPAGIALGVVVAVAASIAIRKAGPAAAIRSIGAVPAAPGSLPRVETLLSGLSVTMGVAAPGISMLVDDIPNAAIVGKRGGATIVVTTGLLEHLSVVELEGVLAHLLAHERLDAVERGTAGAGYALLLGGLGRRGGRAHRLTGEGRLYRADEVAVLSVRYPPGLADALSEMERGPLPAPGSLFGSSVYDTLRWLFIDPSITRRAATDEVGDVDATSVRRRALLER